MANKMMVWKWSGCQLTRYSKQECGAHDLGQEYLQIMSCRGSCELLWKVIREPEEKKEVK
jgi:hypothetical protein